MRRCTSSLNRRATVRGQQIAVLLAGLTPYFPFQGLKKTLSFSTDTQVMEVIRQFNRYCKAENISNFYLAAEPTSSGGEELVLDNMQRLQFYNFGHLVRWIDDWDHSPRPDAPTLRPSRRDCILRRRFHQLQPDQESECPRL